MEIMQQSSQLPCFQGSSTIHNLREIPYELDSSSSSYWYRTCDDHQGAVRNVVGIGNAALAAGGTVEALRP
ncbi:hypothetical protein QTO34_019246 [Cnephaeus nilssonii]|uniref:Uncharacterized protein n=1 Tax=Cnephaeus nilssonii TaxID=3371016 RepID=A0AA40HXB4_CNENI|nr:hypothetical protein QTO34_019246 [Eptesicus nilssonii]